MQGDTKIYIATADGDIVIDDFNNSKCQLCISASCGSKITSSQCCPIDGQRKWHYNNSTSKADVQICDNKERTRNNFNQMAELVYHNHTHLIDLRDRIRRQEVERINTEITGFKHNIETINGESILEFETAISTKKLRKSYKEIVKVVQDTIERDNTMPSFIARQALNNLRIQTEIIVSKIIGDRYDSKSTNSNPWDAVMTNVYLLYPLVQKKNLKINMGEYLSRFNLDYNAVKVSSYYILDNAIKYCLPKTEINISFIEEDTVLRISFRMISPEILKDEIQLIFEKGYRGENVRNLKTEGNGYGLFCSKKLLTSAFADIAVNPGNPEKIINNISYASNEFIISLPRTLQSWK